MTGEAARMNPGTQNAARGASPDRTWMDAEEPFAGATTDDLL